MHASGPGQSPEKSSGEDEDGSVNTCSFGKGPIIDFQLRPRELRFGRRASRSPGGHDLTTSRRSPCRNLPLLCGSRSRSRSRSAGGSKRLLKVTGCSIQNCSTKWCRTPREHSMPRKRRSIPRGNGEEKDHSPEGSKRRSPSPAPTKLPKTKSAYDCTSSSAVDFPITVSPKYTQIVKSDPKQKPACPSSSFSSFLPLFFYVLVYSIVLTAFYLLLLYSSVALFSSVVYKKPEHVTFSDGTKVPALVEDF